MSRAHPADVETAATRYADPAMDKLLALQDEMRLKAYEEAGVVEYWLLDANVRSLEPFVLQNRRYIAATRLSDQDASVGPAALPEPRFALKAIFERDANVDALRQILSH